MTIPDYLMVMTEVRIAELKARLSEYLRKVRRGHAITVLDRDTPVARLVPHGGSRGLLPARKPSGTAGSLQEVQLPPPLKLDFDIVDLLLEERQLER